MRRPWPWPTGGCDTMKQKSSGHYIYVNKDVRMRGYFSKPKGVHEENSLGKTDVDNKSGLFILSNCVYIV
jgi:hypothetical protein